MSYEPSSMFRGTTICAVKKDGVIALAGDGQVTMGEKTIMKATAKKVRSANSSPDRRRGARANF